MKVVFLKEVEGSGRIGDVKNVADGYARNYLLPQGMAAPATPEAIRKAEARAAVEARKQAVLDAAAQALADKLTGVTVTITAKVGSKGRLFGSITQADIADEVAKLLGQEVDRRLVLLAEPIKEAGDHEVIIQLSRNVKPALAVKVVGEGQPAEAEEAKEAKEAAPEEVASEEPVIEEPVAEEAAAAEEAESAE